VDQLHLSASVVTQVAALMILLELALHAILHKEVSEYPNAQPAHQLAMCAPMTQANALTARITTFSTIIHAVNAIKDACCVVIIQTLNAHNASQEINSFLPPLVMPVPVALEALVELLPLAPIALT
jgi:hypothetical protein